MRPKALNNSLLLKTVLILTALLLGQLLMLRGVSAQVAKPFFRVDGADVSAGGGVGAGCGNYQSPAGPPIDNKRGGILTFNRAPNGASGQYAAFALGLIEGTGVAPNDYGFSTPGNNRLSFANSGVASIPASNWGGLFGAFTCTPDYFVKHTTFSGIINTGVYDPAHLTNANRGYFYTGNITVNGGTVPAGADKTFFVDGNVYITGNILYGAHSPVDSIPKFALVASGNIYVAPGVTTLEGFYVAQPSGSNEGMFVTCSTTGNATLPTPAELRGPCLTNVLTVNGAVAAAKVHLLRTQGNALGATGPAERFNYTPDMVLGGGFFNDGTQKNTVDFDSLISLPPIF